MKKHVKTPDEVREPVTYIKDPRLVPVSEIMKMEQTRERWLLENCVPMGNVTTLVGPSDCGKSLFARQLAISVALGQPMMIGQKLNPVTGRVIYVSTEDDPFDWKEKLQRYQLSKEEMEVMGRNLFLVTEYEGLKKLLDKEIPQEPVDLVVVDVFSDVFEGDLNNSIDVRNFLKSYRALAMKFGTAFVFIHHVSKRGEASKNTSKLNVMGSAGMEQTVRSLLYIDHGSTENERLLTHSKANYLSRDLKKKTIHLRLTEQLTFDRMDSGFSVKAEKIEHTRQRVYELFDSGIRSVRSLEKRMREEGIKIGKTSIGQYLKERKETSIDHKKKEG